MKLLKESGKTGQEKPPIHLAWLPAKRQNSKRYELQKKLINYGTLLYVKSSNGANQADQNSLADNKIVGRRWSSFQEIVDDKEGEEEGEQCWRIARAWTVDLGNVKMS